MVSYHYYHHHQQHPHFFSSSAQVEEEEKMKKEAKKKTSLKKYSICFTSRLVCLRRKCVEEGEKLCVFCAAFQRSIIITIIM